MTRLILAEFSDPLRLTEAARRARANHYALVDAFTPFPLEGLEAIFPHKPGPIRVAMFVGGAAAAAIALGAEYYTAVVDYPYNSGGRPLNSWPAFMLVPFAVGILIASITGLATFLVQTGLPRLSHPLFDAPGFERVTRDRFVLALARPENDADSERMADWLRHAGATVREFDG